MVALRCYRRQEDSRSPDTSHLKVRSSLANATVKRQQHLAKARYLRGIIAIPDLSVTCDHLCNTVIGGLIGTEAFERMPVSRAPRP
jgi:hypothetical protein